MYKCNYVNVLKLHKSVCERTPKLAVTVLTQPITLPIPRWLTAPRHRLTARPTRHAPALIHLPRCCAGAVPESVPGLASARRSSEFTEQEVWAVSKNADVAEPETHAGIPH